MFLFSLYIAFSYCLSFSSNIVDYIVFLPRTTHPYNGIHCWYLIEEWSVNAGMSYRRASAPIDSSSRLEHSRSGYKFSHGGSMRYGEYYKLDCEKWDHVGFPRLNVCRVRNEWSRSGRDQWSCSWCSNSNLRPLFSDVSETPPSFEAGRTMLELTNICSGKNIPVDWYCAGWDKREPRWWD